MKFITTISALLFILLLDFAGHTSVQANTTNSLLPSRWSVFATNLLIKSISEDPFGNHVFVGRSELAPTWSGSTSRLTVMKLANDGTFVWSADVGNVEIDSGGNVATATDNQGNIYIGTAVNINPSSHEIITAKLTRDGEEIWLARFNPARDGLYFVRSLRVTENGFVYVLFSNSFSHVDFAESYLASFDSEGSLRWSMKFDGSTMAMKTDKKTGDVTLSGNTRQAFIVRINALGERLWEARPDSENVRYHSVGDMALAEDGSAATIGLMTLTNSPGTTIISTIKYSPVGKQLWQASFSLTNATVELGSLAVLDDGSGGFIAAASHETSDKPKVFVVRYGADGSQQGSFEIDNCRSQFATLDLEGNLVLAGLVSHFNGSRPSLGHLWTRVNLSGVVLARGGVIDADIITMDSKDHLIFAGQRDYHTPFESLKGAYLQKTSASGSGLSYPNVFVFQSKPTSVRQPTNIYLQAFVSGVNDNHRVDFYAGTNLIGSAARPADSSPAFFGTRYFHVWTNAPAGNHEMRAIAVHSSGISNASPRFTITVVTNDPPLVRITSPTNDSIFSGNEPITIHGTVFDPVDRLRKIELFEGPTWIGAVSTNLTSYSFAVPSLGPGSYSIQAVATDENGAKGFSEPVHFQISGFAPSQEPFRGVPVAIPGLIEAEDFDEGGHQTSHFNPIQSAESGSYRTNISVEIRPHSPSSSSRKGHYVDGIRSGGWLEYTIDVAESGPYFVEIRHASESALNLSLELDRQPLLASYEGDYGFGLGHWRLGVKEGIFLPEGRHILRLVTVHSDTNRNRNSQIDFIRIYQSPTRIYRDGSRITVLQHGDYGKPLVVEASTNLVNWLPIQTNLNWFGLPIFSDFQSNPGDRRFFRVRRSPE